MQYKMPEALREKCYQIFQAAENALARGAPALKDHDLPITCERPVSGGGIDLPVDVRVAIGLKAIAGRRKTGRFPRLGNTNAAGILDTFANYIAFTIDESMLDDLELVFGAYFSDEKK